MKVRIFIASFSVCIFIFYLSTGCNLSVRKQLAEGKQLALIACSSCHAFPDPSLLNKKVWGDVLLKMADLMYVDIFYNPYDISGPEGDKPVTRNAQDKLYPYEKWEKIVKYYIATAPVEQPGREIELPEVESDLKNFTVHYINSPVDQPFTSLVQFDTSRHRVFWGDGNLNKILVANENLKRLDSFPVFIGATDINLKKNPSPVITMGILKPSDEKLGKLALVVRAKAPDVLIDSLQRPVQATYADLNEDGQEDIVISEFGFRHGSLSWFESTGYNQYKKHVLRALPGAIRSEIYDLNKDGKPDIIALMAQGDEGVFIYYNEGGGRFREERVLQFPPVYGSSYFQLVDFNHDGWMDILTTAGDNADYSLVAKAYHGIRIFLNDGKNHFEEKYFLPQYGAQKAIPVDFDKDGDLDIVSISFFPDYERLPLESFIFWENKGDNTFKRYSFAGATDGRWLTMDVGDIDGDGDADVILGNAFFNIGIIPQPIKEKWLSHPVSAIILKNNLIRK